MNASIVSRERSYAQGFTLLDLLIAMSVASILLGIGVPSMSDFLQANKGRSVAYQLMTSFQFARNESVKRGEDIKLCGSDDGIKCSKFWRKQVIIFADRNDNSMVENGELIAEEAFNLQSQYMITSVGGTSKANSHLQLIEFKSNGRVNQNGNIIFCNPDALKHSKQIRFYHPGRAYHAKLRIKDDQLLNNDGKPLNCV